MCQFFVSTLIFKNKNGKFIASQLDIQLNEKSTPVSFALGDVNKDGFVDIGGVDASLTGAVDFSGLADLRMLDLKNQGAITAINITGLALGMAAAIFAFLWVQNEMSFDQYHENAANIYRVNTDLKVSNGVGIFSRMSVVNHITLINLCNSCFSSKSIFELACIPCFNK